MSNKIEKDTHFNARDLLLAQPWSHAFFTSYALSLSFVEAVVLEALSRSRSNGGAMTIMVDALGMRSALSEVGASKIGRDYFVEPVLVRNGVFHPKIGVLSSDNDLHLIVGSGNFTFGGWGGNFECIEHLHPSFAASAIRDAATFLEAIATDPRLTHGAVDKCIQTSELLLNSVTNSVEDGRIRLLHSLSEPILDQLIDYAAELGGAQRLTVASPYFDGGPALRALAGRLGLPEVYLHNHPMGAVRGSPRTGWPHNISEFIRPVCVDELLNLDRTKDGLRILHAKMFEIVCTKGRLIVSGSANATMAALDKGRNVEACVLRILPASSSIWTLSWCAPPAVDIQSLNEIEHADQAIGILRAGSEGNHIKGQVLSPSPRGSCTLKVLAGEIMLREVTTLVDEAGEFEALVPELTNEFFRARRIVIEVQNPESACLASGFLSVAGYAGVMRRLGVHGKVLTAFLNGLEASDDATVILEWALQNLSEIANKISSGRAKLQSLSSSATRLITPEMLARTTGELDDRGQPDPIDSSENWHRFIDAFVTSIRASGNKLRSYEEETDEESSMSSGSKGSDLRRENPNKKTEELLDKLLSGLLDGEVASSKDRVKNLVFAWDLVRFAFCRGEPGTFEPRSYIRRIAGRAMKTRLEGEERELIASVVILLNGGRYGNASALRVRRDLLTIGWDFSIGPPSLEAVRCFDPEISDSIWEDVLGVRAPNEIMADIQRACEKGAELPNIDFLNGSADREAKEIRRVFYSQQWRNRFVFLEDMPRGCPACSMGLTLHERNNLEANGCTVHVSARCGRVILITGTGNHGNG